jgi:RNA polymerase sporulation-specific sigma factor
MSVPAPALAQTAQAPPTDAELAARSRAGDGRAFEELARRYEAFMRRLATRWFAEGDDIDDLLQEALIGLYSATLQYRAGSGTPFHAFAHMCIRRRLITRIIASRRRKHEPLNEALSLFHGDERGDTPHDTLIARLPSAADRDPLDIVIERETAREVAELAERALSPLEARVLARRLEGAPYQDIAAEIRRSWKTVDNAVQRIREKLGHALGVRSAGQKRRAWARRPAQPLPLPQARAPLHPRRQARAPRDRGRQAGALGRV